MCEHKQVWPKRQGAEDEEDWKGFRTARDEPAAGQSDSGDVLKLRHLLQDATPGVFAKPGRDLRVDPEALPGS
jgi:hypothetical protein